MTMAAGVVALRSPSLSLLKARSLKRQIASGSLPPGEGFEKIEDAGSQMTRLSQALDQYSSADQDKSKVTLCDLREIVMDVIAAMEGPKETGIRFKTYLRPVSLVEADPKEIQEMLAHLITNGIEAMPEGGDLYLSTEENAGYANIFIQDSGAGIADDLQTRIFDPFFTTKGSDRSGLGLSLPGLSEGTKAPEVTSRKGHGTIVSIRCPCTEKGKDDGRVRTEIRMPDFSDRRDHNRNPQPPFKSKDSR
jgi:signal transduction histidine kinase